MKIWVIFEEYPNEDKDIMEKDYLCATRSLSWAFHKIYERTEELGLRKVQGRWTTQRVLEVGNFRWVIEQKELYF